MSKDTVEPTPPSDAPETALSPAQIEELKTQAAQAADYWDRLLRATANFDNYKKRAARERQDAVNFANQGLIQKMIPVLDNFEAALTARPGDGDGGQALLAGVGMIQQQLKAVLIEAGLEEVDATGKAFDPNLHEAVSQMESADHPDGNVLQQLRKGYRLRDRLLRPATVIVAKAPAENTE